MGREYDSMKINLELTASNLPSYLHVTCMLCHDWTMLHDIFICELGLLLYTSRHVGRVLLGACPTLRLRTPYILKTWKHV